MAERGPAMKAGQASARPIWMEAVRVALGRPPLWLVVWSVDVLLALAPALLLRRWLHDEIAHHYEPGSLFGNLDAFFRFDHRVFTTALDHATQELGSVLALLAVLFGTFSAGGWLQVFLERTQGHSLRRFFLGGARYFWRFLRLALVTILALSLLTWILHGPVWNRLVLRGLCGVPASDVATLETFASEWAAFSLRGAQQVLYAIGFALVLVWGDYARTRLALHDTSSAAWAGICTAFTLLRHPVRTLRPMAGLFVLELAIVVGAGTVARAIEEEVSRNGGLVEVGLLLALSQFALLWRVVLRGARYHAAVQVSREIVRPLARPDPWRESLGTEGGPRYPIGGDEYGMSL